MHCLLSDVRPFYWTVDSLTHFSISAVRVGVWMFESEYCRAKLQKWMHPQPGQEWPGHERTCFYFSSLQKGHGGLEKDLCLLPLLSQLRYLPFFLPRFCSFFLSSSLYSLLTSALPRGYVSTGRTDAQAEMNMIRAFLPKQTWGP